AALARLVVMAQARRGVLRGYDCLGILSRGFDRYGVCDLGRHERHSRLRHRRRPDVELARLLFHRRLGAAKYVPDIRTLTPDTAGSSGNRGCGTAPAGVASRCGRCRYDRNGFCVLCPHHQQVQPVPLLSVLMSAASYIRIWLASAIAILGTV